MFRSARPTSGMYAHDLKLSKTALYFTTYSQGIFFFFKLCLFSPEDGRIERNM